MNIIKQIINKCFCCHEWEKLERVDMYSNTLPSIITIYYCCKKCGKIKKIVIKN